MQRPRPSVFVSHSAKEPVAKELLNGLADALRAAGFDPYVADQRMRRGRAFRKELYEKLLTCEGAVLLLSPAALHSPWVHREATVLVARHTEERAFPFLPFLVAGTTREDVKNSQLGGLGITDLHAPRTGADRIVHEIVETFAERHGPPRPLHPLEVTIAHLLGGLDDEALALAADALGLDITGWQPHGRRIAVARQMLQTDVPSFSRMMERICGMVSDPVGIIERAFPFTWIDGAAVGPITRAAEPAAPRPPLAVNSERERTGRWYVRRACPEPQSWRVTGVRPEHESYDAALVVEVRRAVLEELAFEWDDEVSEAELRAALDGYEEVYGPIFVLLPAAADEISVATLRESFPSLVFLVLAGPAVGGRIAAGGVRVLAPLLDPAVEHASHSAYQLLRKRVGDEPVKHTLAPGRRA